MKKIAFIIVAGIALLTLLFFWREDAIAPEASMPGTSPIVEGTLPLSSSNPEQDVEVIAENLDIPWEAVFLPDGSMLVTQRSGDLVRIHTTRQTIPIDGVVHRGEGGLLGLALHPDFVSNRYIYLYLTTQSGGGLSNRVERYMLNENKVSDRTVIVDNIPGSVFHDGGRIAFGPDDMLYFATGDAGKTANAQDSASLAGKILRVHDDGSIPSDNPFQTAVYSYGHRNVQGLAWDSAGVLWATEHGRSGIASGFDEINLIRAGRNYGWPEIQGNETQSGMEVPIAHSGANDTWAPSGAVIVENSLFFAGLKGEALYKADIVGDTIERITPFFKGEFGRLRTVLLGPDNQLYVLTNNTDGRGNAKAGDDRIIRINPESIK